MAFSSVLGDVQFLIDYLDLTSVQKVPMLNQLGVDHNDGFIRENYRYNWMLQLDLSTVNGVTTISQNFNSAKISSDRSIIRRSSIPIATVFVQTMHED